MSHSDRCGNQHSLPISVLIVDDSLFMRTIVSDLLSSDLGIIVVGTASSGSEAIRKITEIKPDCVMLDLMMPGLDGLVTLKIIMAACPTPVIILSAYCDKWPDMMTRCTAAGAVGLIPKPAGEMSLDMSAIRQRLVSEVKRVATWRSSELHIKGGSELKRGNTATFRTCELVLIGASTGGHRTLENILRELPSHLPFPVLVIQHAPDESLTQSFAERLNRVCKIPVKVAEDGERPYDGVVYLAPGGSYLTLCDSETLPLRQRERNLDASRPGPCFRINAIAPGTLTPPIDPAMESAATVYGSNVMGIILTGMGDDGLQGMRAVKTARGRTIVQDESAIMFSMPRAVIEAGLADEVLSPEGIARIMMEAGS